MLSIRVIVFIFLAVITITSNGQNESAGYLVIDKYGYGNIIFASEKITVGGEGNIKIKEEFTFGEQIWGRAYFPEKFKNYEVTDDDKFFLEISIDNQVIQTVYQGHPEDEWGQMQVWISGTENDYFPLFFKTIKEAETGKYKISVKIGIKKFIGETEIDTSPSSVKKQKQKNYTDMIISNGSFDLIKL